MTPCEELKECPPGLPVLQRKRLGVEPTRA